MSYKALAATDLDWTPIVAIIVAILAPDKAMGNALVDRRNFLVLTGTALTQPACQWLFSRLGPVIAQGGGKEVTSRIVDQLNWVTDDLRLLDEERGGGTVIPVALAHLRFMISLLDSSKFTEDVGRRLFAAVAEAA